MRKNIVFSLIIISLFIVAWHKILVQTITGEGYYYFFNGLKENNNIFRYDIGASLLLDLIKPVFKDNFFFYQLFLFIAFIALGILFYFVVYELTHKKSVAFISSILFIVNYNTVFEMVATGAYQNFVQRVFFLLLLFPSFILFIKFINYKKIIYYLASLIFGLFSVSLAYFSFFYIPFLTTFFLGYLFSKKIKFKEIIFAFSSTIIYVLACLFVINIPVILKMPNMMPSESFFAFSLHNINEIIINFFRQLTILSVPDVILRQIFSFFNTSIVQAIYYNSGIQYLYLPVFLIYLTAGIFLYKKEKKQRTAIIASLLFLPSVFILNLYIRTDHVSRLEPGSRYLFVPSLGYSIFWGIFLSHFLSRGKNAVYLIIFGWAIIQLFAINRQFKAELYNHIATKKIVSYFKNDLSSKLKNDSIVITPYVMGNWGSWFLNMYYGKKNTIFTPQMTPQFEWRSEFKRSFDSKKDFIIYYDQNNQEVIDITQEYKTIIKNR